VNTRSMPMSEDGEKGLISALLHNPIEICDLIDLELRTGGFYLPAHSYIKSAISRLIDKKSQFDFPHLIEQLKADGTLIEVGGKEYVSAVWDFIPCGSTMVAESYIELLNQKARRRDMIRIANQLLDDGYDDTVEVREGIDRGDRSVSALAIEGLKKMIDWSKQVQDFVEEVDKNNGKPIEGVIKFGIKGLDKALINGLHPSEVCLISAGTSDGKSAMAMHLALNAALKQKLPTVIFSLEGGTKRLLRRIFASEAKIPVIKFRKNLLDAPELARLGSALLEVQPAPIFADTEVSVNISQIKARIRQISRKLKIGLVVIDYAQLVIPERINGTREQDVAETSKQIRAISCEHDLVAVLLSQINDDGQVRESRALEHDCDVHLRITRDSDAIEKATAKTTAELAKIRQSLKLIEIRKFRDGERGGKIPVWFHGEHMAFADRAIEQEPDDAIHGENELPFERQQTNGHKKHKGNSIRR